MRLFRPWTHTARDVPMATVIRGPGSRLRQNFRPVDSISARTSVFSCAT
jgi:hypothetical protein